MPQLRGRATDRDRRELEVLHRVAVTLSQSLSLADVLTSLTRELVYGVERAGEVAISLWNVHEDVLGRRRLLDRCTGRPRGRAARR